MNQTTEYLTCVRRINKLHESMLKDACTKYRLSLIEATIISFLYNNPEKDTAADIVELRMLQKGNVSQAVESLSRKGLLKRDADQTDRRRIHLSLTAKAEPVTRFIAEVQAQFLEEIFMGISTEARKTFDEVNRQVAQNLQNIIQRREYK